MAIWVTWPAWTKFGTLGIAAGLLTLAGERSDLLKNNMFDLEDYAKLNGKIVCDERSKTARTEDGTCNILSNPAEGSVYVRFGRNVNPSKAAGETEANTLLSPNPREVSNTLLARGEFKPAPSLNFIAASWIQFMVHDWVDHGENQATNPIKVPLPAGDTLGSGTLNVRRTQADPSRTAADAGKINTYRNHNTHWWDGSQLYGSSKAQNDKVRSFVDGKLKINADGTLPTELLNGKPVTGFNENWWVGLSMLHQIFTKEHNAIATMLKQKYPSASDQWLYDKARLINAALMAKIHTVEWTPAVIANPVTERAMYANWWGLIGNATGRDKYQAETRQWYSDLSKTDSWLKTFLNLNSDLAGTVGSGTLDHALAGLVGSANPNNYGVPYTLTEEFVSVYRMHPLMRDNVQIYDVGSNVISKTVALPNTRDRDAESMLKSETPERLWYSFGITNPGSLTLNNFPNFLRNLSIPLVGNIDLATIDILRDRERGVPRYNEFRRQIRLNPITKFEDLTSDAKTLANLKRIYSNDIEKIDTLVGMMAESTRPDGFAFGETAFQIFILNASRRLMTDRFFTKDYTPAVYTPEGYSWVENTTMVDVIKRHNPTLALSLTGMDNAFKPWGLNMPAEYESWSAATKADHLWVNGALRTQYKTTMPALKKVDTGGLISSILWKKVQNRTDVAPAGYTKPIHPYGAMAKVKFVPVTNSYTGLFQGADSGLLRLSVTENPAEGAFQAGLAWKVFVNGKPSENISALYTLAGQGQNHNFFANELSSYVSTDINNAASTILFSAVTAKPTMLMMNDMAEVTQAGVNVGVPKAPTQIYFVPRPEVKTKFATAAHDFRYDLVTLGAGSPVYDIYATSMEIKTSIIPSTHQTYAAQRRASATKVGTLELTSPMIVSAFGDQGVFFKHQRYEDK